MFKKRKNKFIILISSLSIISLFSIGLGSFIIVNEANITLNMTPNYGVVSNNIEGISISGNTSLSMGKYFYYENNSSVKEGTLSYLINVSPSKLSNDLKVSNDNGGYSFTLLGSLEINNLEIFNDNKNFLKNIWFVCSRYEKIKYNMSITYYIKRNIGLKATNHKRIS